MLPVSASVLGFSICVYEITWFQIWPLTCKCLSYLFYRGYITLYNKEQLFKYYSKTVIKWLIFYPSFPQYTIYKVASVIDIASVCCKYILLLLINNKSDWLWKCQVKLGITNWGMGWRRAWSVEIQIFSSRNKMLEDR